MGIRFLVEPQKRGELHRNLYLPSIANVCNEESEPDKKTEYRCRQGKSSQFARLRTGKKEAKPARIPTTAPHADHGNQR